MIVVKSESQRKEEAIKYCKQMIDGLTRDMNECDYEEDVNGDLVYSPGCYADEKRQFEHERRKWEVMLKLLTNDAPFSMLDW